MAESLEESHLADLHALAAQRGVPRYRLLRRDQLIAAIEARGDGDEPPTEEVPVEAPDAEAVEAPDAEDEGAPPREDEEEPDQDEDDDEGDDEDDDEGEVVVEGTLIGAEDEDAVEVDAEGAEPRERDRPSGATEEVVGVLEVMPQRFGFIRLHGLEPGPDDVYISASQVRRCELRPGDEVAGPAREPRRGERHRALVHVDQVNGEEPLATARPDFDDLPPGLPSRRVPLDADRGDVLSRAVDLLTPLALGQRVLVRAAPRSGRTTLLRGIARAVAAMDGPELIVLLIDEKPEEAPLWRQALPEAELAIATADLAPADQVHLAELALGRGRRRAEVGADAVLVVDSLSRLAFAAGDAASVKRVFGSGRDLEGGGSLTVIATVLADSHDEGEAERAVITTESSMISLDPALAADGVVPALRTAECRVSNEEALREPEELAAVRRLRSLLADLDPQEAAKFLRERIEASPTNAELLAGLD